MVIPAVRLLVGPWCLTRGDSLILLQLMTSTPQTNPMAMVELILGFVGGNQIEFFESTQWLIVFDSAERFLKMTLVNP